MTMTNEELLARVRQWRESLSLSQYYVAKQIDAPRGTYALWEQGRGKLAAERLNALVGLLNGQRINAGLPVLKVKPFTASEAVVVAEIAVRPKLRVKLANPVVHKAAGEIVQAYVAQHSDMDMGSDAFLKFYAEIVDALSP